VYAFVKRMLLPYVCNDLLLVYHFPENKDVLHQLESQQLALDVELGVSLALL
jgi:hypothetical protein